MKGKKGQLDFLRLKSEQDRTKKEEKKKSESPRSREELEVTKQGRGIVLAQALIMQREKKWRRHNLNYIFKKNLNYS